MAPSWKQVPKKTSKNKINQSCFGSYFGSLLLPNRFHLHFLCDIFCAYFRHRFWEASTSILEDFGGHFRMPFELILNTFPKILQNSKNATFSSEMLGLGVGPPFWHLFCLLFECVFRVAFQTDFLLDFGGFGPLKEVCVGSILRVFADFA